MSLHYTTRNIAIVFFGLGLLTLATHYLPKWAGMLARTVRGQEAN